MLGAGRSSTLSAIPVVNQDDSSGCESCGVHGCRRVFLALLISSLPVGGCSSGMVDNLFSSIILRPKYIPPPVGRRYLVPEEDPQGEFYPKGNRRMVPKLSWSTGAGLSKA